MALRDQILDAKDLKEEVVDVPEWGGRMLLVEMDGLARLSFDDETAAIKADGTKESALRSAARLLVRCIHDPETRERVFTDADVDRLCRKNHRVLVRLAGRAMALNIAGEKEVAAEAGKSEGVQPGA